MNYDDALQRLREVPVEPPTFTAVEQRRRWRSETPIPPTHGALATIATGAAMLGYLVLTAIPFVTHRVLYGSAKWESLATLLPAALLLWALRLLGRPGVGPQMLLRAVLWSNLIVGALIASNYGFTIDRWVGAAISVASAAAIVRLGSRGLEDGAPSDVFRPLRFRGHLLLALVMAFADAQTLSFAALLQLRIGMPGWNLQSTISFAGPTVCAALGMVLVVWGLYRLRTWALLLNPIANVAIAYFALEGTLNVSLPVATTLAATAAFQMFLPVPIFAVALGDRNAGQPLLRMHALVLLRSSVMLIAGIAVAAAIVVREPSGWLTGSGTAFARGLPTFRSWEEPTPPPAPWPWRSFMPTPE